MLALVRLEKDANRLVGQYSMGMRQRLGMALALLNQPVLLMLDEPTNGLDPAGIHEVRELLRTLPQAEGVTVFISSHLLSEVEQTASHLGIIQQGRLLFQGPLSQLQAQFAQQLWLRVDRPEEAMQHLRKQGWQASKNGKPEISVEVNGDADAALVNNTLVYNGFNVFRLDLARPALEDVFLSLTGSPVSCGRGGAGMKHYWNALTTELMKLRRTLAFWCILIGPSAQTVLLYAAQFSRKPGVMAQ